ncbi:MAG: hypothetical protein ACREMV_13200 [Gemmatimonadales bacterium]
MTKPFIAIVLVALPAAALAGQAPPPDGIRVTTTGAAREITGRVLDSLAVDTVIASFHERPPATYVGVGVDRLLAYAGVIVAGSRGRDFEQVVVVEAHDGYRMTFGVGEIDPSITGRRIVLARATGEGEGEGPWRLVVPGDRRGARWVRQVRSIRLVRISG